MHHQPQNGADLLWIETEKRYRPDQRYGGSLREVVPSAKLCTTTAVVHWTLNSVTVFDAEQDGKDVPIRSRQADER